MPAIDYSEDTEFNEALRKHGIIPKLPSPDRSPPPSPPRSPSPTLSDLSDLDDILSRDTVERYREIRMREVGTMERNRKFGRVFPIGKTDYTREITEASKVDLEGEGMPGEGTGVVCILYKDS